MKKHSIREQQAPLDGFVVSRLKLVGVIDDINDNYLPDLDDILTLTVKVRCTDRAVKRMSNGELRRVAVITVDTAEITQGPTKPTGEPHLFSEDQ